LVLHNGWLPKRLLARAELSLQHALVCVVQEVFQVIRLLRELLRDDPGNCCNVGVVVRLESLNLPQTAFSGIGMQGIQLGLIEGVVHAPSFDIGCEVLVANFAVHHECAGGVALEQVVHERNNNHDGGRRSVQRQAGEALEEAGNEGGWKMGGGEEGIQQTEEAGAVLGVEEVRVQEGVEFCVELRVVKVLVLDQVEKTGQGEERGCAAHVVRVRQEVHQEFWSAEPRLDSVHHDAQKGLPLRLREIVPEDGQPCFLCSPLVRIHRHYTLAGGFGLNEEFLEFVIFAGDVVACREKRDEGFENIRVSAGVCVLAI